MKNVIYITLSILLFFSPNAGLADCYTCNQSLSASSVFKGNFTKYFEAKGIDLPLETIWQLFDCYTEIARVMVPSLNEGATEENLFQKLVALPNLTTDGNIKWLPGSVTIQEENGRKFFSVDVKLPRGYLQTIFFYNPLYPPINYLKEIYSLLGKDWTSEHQQYVYERGFWVMPHLKKKLIDRRTFVGLTLHSILPEAFYRALYSEEADSILKDPALKHDRIARISDRDIDTVIEEESRKEFWETNFRIDHIIYFAKAVLDDVRFKGKKIVVIGRAGDLIYDALYGLIHLVPEYRERASDLLLIDYSTILHMSPLGGVTEIQMAEYIHGRGLNPEQGVVFVDEWATHLDNYTFRFKHWLTQFLDYPEDKINTALMFQNLFLPAAPVYFNKYTLDDVDLEYVRDLVSGSEAVAAQHVARYLANTYDSGREYKGITKDASGAITDIEYKYYKGSEDLYHLRRFLYKCRIYAEILQRKTELSQTGQKPLGTKAVLNETDTAQQAVARSI